jgi:hypothetical protein
MPILPSSGLPEVCTVEVIFGGTWLPWSLGARSLSGDLAKEGCSQTKFPLGVYPCWTELDGFPIKRPIVSLPCRSLALSIMVTSPLAQVARTFLIVVRSSARKSLAPGFMSRGGT